MPSKQQVMERLQGVFRDVFDEDDLLIEDETTAADVDGWDSLKHITLMVSVEKEFGIRLSASEIGALKNVGELLTVIERRLNV